MLTWIIFIAELATLLLTSRFVSKAIFIVSYKILRSEKRAIIPVFIIFLPGVIVHELAHFLMAEILLVKAHNMEIWPKIENGGLKMGSVQVSKSDIFRQMLIGIAPIIFGVAILTAGIYSFLHLVDYSKLLTTPVGIITIIFLIYVVFTITNTMFSSKKDLDGLLEFSVVIAFIVLIFTFVGIFLKINFWDFISILVLNKNVIEVLTLINWLLAVPVAINLSFVSIAQLLSKGRL